MKIRPGITQSYYKTIAPDRKLQWKLAMWCISLAASWLVTKTGYRLLDFLISTSCTLVTMLIIESQRSYSDYSRNMRKLMVTATLVIVKWGVIGFGVLYVALVTVGALGNTLQNMPSLDRLPEGIQVACAAGVLGVGICKTVEMFRRMGLEEVLAQLPTKGLKELLLKRRPIAKDGRTFVIFELGVTVVGYLFASTAAGLANILIHLPQA